MSPSFDQVHTRNGCHYASVLKVNQWMSTAAEGGGYRF